MYNFNDKQRRRLLEDALVAELLGPASSLKPRVQKTAVRPAPAAAVPQAPGKAAA